MEKGCRRMFVVKQFGRSGVSTCIHRVGCRHAKPAGHTTRNTRWHPSWEEAAFIRYEFALDHARSLAGRQSPQNCRVCRPNDPSAMFSVEELSLYVKAALELMEVEG